MPVNPAKPPERATAAKKTAAQSRSEAVKSQNALTTARVQAINGVFQVSTLGLLARGMYADAGAIADHGPRISIELATLAESDSRIASVVDYLTSAGPYTGLVLAVLPLALQLAANHGRIDPDRAAGLGVKNPRELEAEVKRDIDKQKTDLGSDLDGLREDMDQNVRRYP